MLSPACSRREYCARLCCVTAHALASRSGFLPCAIWTISGFYNRREIGKRMSFFYLVRVEALLRACQR